MQQGQEITCPICRRANPDFDAINERINRAKTPAEKTPHARELIKKVEAVVYEHRGSQGDMAMACMELLNLRKQTAELILKFQR